MFAVVALVLFGGSLASARVMGIDPTPKESKFVGATSGAVYLTPYIEKNKLAAGRKAAKVSPLLGSVESYAGFYTVNSTSNSNMYLWFFPAETDAATAPVTLWLQGGPGSSSLYGLFYENGPFTILENLTLKEQCYRWTKTMNMIYIDSPVGTGFSYTEDDSAYARNETDVARDLYNALIQFFTLFPTYKSNPFYISGESYAGKYIPALGYYIHTHNPEASLTINLTALAIGNGLVDPKNMMKYGEYLYQHGLIDNVALKKFRKEEAKTVKEIKNKNWEAASSGFYEIIEMFSSETQDVDVYDYLLNDTADPDYTSNYFNSSSVRNKIHVGNHTFQDGTIVQEYLYNDVSKSVVSWLEVLINHYRVVLYSGQVDVIVAYPLTLSFVQKMTWNGSKAYKNADRVLWHVNGKLAGFARSGGNFTEVLVRDAGHMVPWYQPLFAYDLITRVVGGIPFNETIKIDESCGTI